MELQDIDGLGPAREESVVEAGYDGVEQLADANPEELAEEIEVPEDTALDFVVQAQNLVPDEDDADEEDESVVEEPITQQIEDALDEPDEEEEVEEVEEEVEEVEEEEEVEEDGPDEYDIALSFDTMLEYDTYHAALMRRHETIYTGNEPVATSIKMFLDGLDNFEKVEYTVDQQDLNRLHQAVNTQRLDYQGNNLIDHMEALREVEKQIDEARQEYLF